MTVDTSRELLFGLLALQVSLIDQGQLLAALEAWTREKSRPLAEHLLSRGDLDADDRLAVEVLVSSHVRRHGGDADSSLAAIPIGESTRESLAGFGDSKLQTTMALLTAGPADSHVERTAAYSVGATASGSQRFRVLRPHARGGLGAVFVALDRELHREVALKQILDHHADDPASRQRFLNEAEITGGLEHPGIVPVYGLGAYGDGRPYYAMRFIRGDSLKQAIERYHARPMTTAPARSRDLELRRLLRRFLDVCNAIDYAHSRGVLHRDIKPGNIIVGQYGETLVVDWGLAKATGRADPSASERTLMPSSSSGSAETLPGTAIGTPAYMSPERAAGELDQLGPTSDVYSLGATLYCLLTGRPPFDGKDAAVVLKSVQDGAFPWPRQIEPSIHNALQAVCLKAMARKPGDRYATPKSLADDIEHWLADQPVTAWREPLSRRLRRWARQHRSLVTAAAAAGIVALAGLGAVAAVQADANSRLRYTNIELTVANAKVTKGNADLLQANERERQRFELATEAIRRYHTGVSEDILLKQEQFKELRTRLLRDALEFYHKLERLLSDGSDTRSRRALGRAYEEVGELTDKIGATEDAIAAHRKALDVRKSLVTEASSELVSRIEAGRTLNAIGTLHAKISQFDEALRSFAEARSLLEDPVAAGSDRPAALSELARSHYGTGSTYYQAGKMREALASYESSRSLQLRLAANKLDTLEDQRLLSWCENDIGLIRSEEGRISEALAALERSQRIKQEIVRAHPEVAEYQRDLAISHNNIGVVLREQGNPEDALVAHEAARRLRQNVASAYPTVTSSQRELANSLIEIGEILFTVRRTDQARMRIGAAIAILEDLQTTDSDVLSTHVRMLQALKGLGAVEVVEGHAAAAQALLKKGIAIGEQLGSNQGEALYYLACCHALLGGVIRSQGPADPSAEGARQLDQAMDTLRRAVAAGHRPLEWLKRDADLDPLRRRSDFQALLLDLAFPTESFVE